MQKYTKIYRNTQYRRMSNSDSPYFVRPSTEETPATSNSIEFHYTVKFTEIPDQPITMNNCQYRIVQVINLS